MKLIPVPKIIDKKNEYIKYNTIKFENISVDDRIKKAVEKLPCSDDGIELEIFVGNNDSECYTLDIIKDKIIIKSDGLQGAFYGIQTLRQIFKNEKIPYMHIEDCPDFKYRGFYHDVTRGKVPTVETIKKLIDDMAYYKLNSLQLYVEHTFEFKEFADSIEKTGYLSAEEIQEIDKYCKMNFIDFIPSIATFGHLYELLEKESYKHLREIEEFNSRNFWEDRMMHHTIDPTKDESFELVKSLIDQYVVNFSSDKFNICCDETFDLKTGKHKDEDTGKLYFNFVGKLIEYLKSRGKTVMMWADILLNYPEQINSLPEDVHLLNWHYWDKPNEDTFKTIRDSGYSQIVCPGTGSWSRFCENYEMDIVNITKMVDLGYKYGAYGVLNTNWGDWGNPCSIELAMFGFVLGAAKSWNVSTVVDEEYISAVNKLLYKKEGANKYIKRLSDLCNIISWPTMVKHYSNMIKGQVVFENVVFPTEAEISMVIDKCFELIDEVSNEKWQEEKIKEQIILSAKCIALMTEILAGCAEYSIERKTDTKKIVESYRKKWLEDNKESELSEIEKVFLYLDDMTYTK